MIFSHIQEDKNVQRSLFDTHLQIEKAKQIYDAVDSLSGKFGKHTVHLGSSLKANHFDQHLGDRGDKPERREVKLKGETSRQRLNIPMLGIEIK